jgi:hypothetical protein
MPPFTRRREWVFFTTLPRADTGLAVAWFSVLVLRGMLPVLFAVVMGILISAVQRGTALALPLAVAGVIFIALQVLPPIHTAVGQTLGDRTAAFLYDRLTIACVRPPGIAHLEHPELTNDLTVARDFDLGMTGPPINVSMDFIASGLSELIIGSCARVRCGATDTLQRSEPPSATRTMRIAWRSIRRRPRSCGSSGSRAG